MTEVEQPPQNGIGLSAAEEDENSKARPADIEQDMREMERRKRVEAIMGSKLFREELERIVDSAREGGASGILQQLSDIVGVPVTRVGNVFKTSNCMVPINDIRGVESMGYAKGEKILRCKLAATFRLLDLYGWTQGLGAQITARLKVDQEYFLVNPYGLLYHEITASALNKVDMQGNIVEQGTTNFGVNKSHFMLHSVIHAARPDIRCAIYIGCSPVVAISSLKTGLLPLTKDACMLGEITTHAYIGILDEEERNKLVRNLGPNSKVILLANHGALCCGETIEEAFFAACHIVQACKTQLTLLPVGIDNLVLIPEESRKIIYEQSRRPPEDLEKKFAAALATVEEAAAKESDNAPKPSQSTTPKWRVGGAEFEALMRMLDNAGYRTGYIYRHPLVKSEPPKPKNDVELPPAVSSLGYLLEEEELFRQGIWKKGDLRKGGDRSRWLNSPNVYQKVEVLETGTPDPKKITKWVAEDSPTHSTPVRIDDPLQFVPAGTTTKEFKRLQQQIKDNRRADKISAGPQSHILEGVTWDEANRIKDATVSQTGDHVVLMGAASKGIIQRGFQHNATVYKAPYAKNPFDNVTDDELNEYKRTVERKKKSIHGEYTDTDFSESEALSSLQTSGAHQTKQTTTTTTAAVSQSEPETSEHQVLRIETQQAPVPSQAEVVLSDATLSFINGERSHTATNRKPPTGREQVQEEVHMSNKRVFDDNDSNKENSCEINLTSSVVTQERKTPKCRRELLHEMQNGPLFQMLTEKCPTVEQQSQQQQQQQQRLHKELNANALSTHEYCCMYYRQMQERHQSAGNSSCGNVDHYAEPALYSYVNMADYNGGLVSSNSTTATTTTTASRSYVEPQEFYKLTNATAGVACSRPGHCSGILQALHKHHNEEKNLICNIPFSVRSLQPYCGSTTTSTTAESSPRLRPSCTRQRPLIAANSGTVVSSSSQSNPYRTNSHFGFNSPSRAITTVHKHIPPVVRSMQPYKPMSRAVSYEEIFATPRYETLCAVCFDKLLRLKPELCAQQQQHQHQYQHQQQQQQEHGYSPCDSYATNVEFDFNECFSESTTETSPFIPQLDTLPELDEFEIEMPALIRGKASLPCTQQRSGPSQTMEKSVSTTTFLSQIGRLNFSEESANPNFVPTTGSSIASDFGIADISALEIAEYSECEEDQAASAVSSSALTTPTCATRANAQETETLPTVTAITEVWNFGNWQQRNERQQAEGGECIQSRSNPITERRVVLEITQCFNANYEREMPPTEVAIESNRPLMTREERMHRKSEFQDLWEDHVAYFGAREEFIRTEQNATVTDTGTAKCSKQNKAFRMNPEIQIKLPKTSNDVEIQVNAHDLLEKRHVAAEDVVAASTNFELCKIVPAAASASATVSKDHQCHVVNLEMTNEEMPNDGMTDEIQTENENKKNINESQVMNLIDQFEQGLSLAGKNLNRLLQIVARQYLAIHENSVAVVPLNSEISMLKTDDAAICKSRTIIESEGAMDSSIFETCEETVVPPIQHNVSTTENHDEATMPFYEPQQELRHYRTWINISELTDEEKLLHDITKSSQNSLFNETFDAMHPEETNPPNINIMCENNQIQAERENESLADIEEKQDTEMTKEEPPSAQGMDTDAEYSSLEREILSKIEEEQLKESDKIFDKIDNTIRNKLTTSKLQQIVREQTKEIYPTRTHVYASSTPTRQRIDWQDFHFDKSFLQNQVNTNFSETVNDIDSDQSMTEQNQTEPSCSKYSTKEEPSRRSRSLTPPRSHPINKSTYVRASGVIDVGNFGMAGGIYKFNRTQLAANCTSSGIIRATAAIPSTINSPKKSRNFILENIRNAGKSKTPMRRQGLSSLTINSGTSTQSSNEPMTSPTSVCSFQARAGDSPRLWVTMPRTPTSSEASKQRLKWQQKQIRPFCRQEKYKRAFEKSPKSMVIKRRKKSKEESQKNKMPLLNKPDSSLIDLEAKSPVFFSPINDELNSQGSMVDADIDCFTAYDLRSAMAAALKQAPLYNLENGTSMSSYSLNACPSMMHLQTEEHHSTLTKVTPTKVLPTTSVLDLYNTSTDDEVIVKAPSAEYIKNEPQAAGYALNHNFVDLANISKKNSSMEIFTYETKISEINSLEPSEQQQLATQDDTDDEQEEIVLDTKCTIKNLMLQVTDEILDQTLTEQKATSSSMQVVSSEEMLQDGKQSEENLILDKRITEQHEETCSSDGNMGQPAVEQVLKDMQKVNFNDDVLIPYQIKKYYEEAVAAQPEIPFGTFGSISSASGPDDTNSLQTAGEQQKLSDMDLTEANGIDYENVPVPYPLQTDNFALKDHHEDDNNDESERRCGMSLRSTATGVDCVIEALSEEIEQFSPRLKKYKRKIEDLSEHVAQCGRHMEACVSEQEELVVQQRELNERIMLNQYAEEISCKINTFSLSETDD